MKALEPLQVGDVIFTDHVLYRHFGVYAGKNCVIHYAGERGHFGGDIEVRETSLKDFAKDGEYRIVKFPGANQFSRKETVRRARSRIGEKSYNLLFNNCEHFALWCKTGKSKSIQVEQAVTTAIVLGTVAVVAHLEESSDEG
jgi:hypothetical protein